MAIRGRTQAWTIASLWLIVGGAVGLAQTTQPAGSARQDNGAAPNHWVTVDPAHVSFVRGQRIRITRGGVVQVSTGAESQADSGVRRAEYLDGVYRSASDVPSPNDEHQRLTPASAADNRPAGADAGARQAGYNDWPWYGYPGYVPAPIYPDDVIFYGGNAYAYGRTIDAGFDAGKDAGRREMLFKGALDIYNERMNNPPARAPEAAPPAGYGYYGGGPAFPLPPSWDAYGSGYRSGQYEAELWLARDRNLLRTAKAYVTKGQELFRAGKYEEAAAAFRLAATSDNGDASSRLLAAHAYFALGRYGSAMAYLRRAFELQPKIALLDFSIQAEYGNLDELDKQLETLKKHCETTPNDSEAWLLLGYVYRHSGEREASTSALARAYKLMPNDRLVKRLLDVDPDPRR
jgi:hypothetical protein